eukprot:2467-Heterococcus_DN1.PRE.1
MFSTAKCAPIMKDTFAHLEWDPNNWEGCIRRSPAWLYDVLVPCVLRLLQCLPWCCPAESVGDLV